MKYKVRSQPSSDTTLVSYIHKLTPKDKAIILGAVQKHGTLKHIHPGTLPFLKIKAVDWALKNTITDANRRTIVSILSKIEAYKVDGAKHFLMYLDPVKVTKYFGPYPERGKIAHWLPRIKDTHAIVKAFGKEVPDKTATTSHVVKLVRFGPSNLWEVTAPPNHRYEVEAWLLDHCL